MAVNIGAFGEMARKYQAGSRQLNLQNRGELQEIPEIDNVT